jgi:NADH dehydrogenase FAD-containing subunit
VVSNGFSLILDTRRNSRQALARHRLSDYLWQLALIIRESKMENTDVIIVGAGPSGLALAIALAARKVKVSSTLFLLMSHHCPLSC